MMSSKRLDGDDALALLREQAGLFPEIPDIESAHVNGPVVEYANGAKLIPICAHDRANERVHQVLYPVGADEPLPDAETCVKHIRLNLAAAWN